MSAMCQRRALTLCSPTKLQAWGKVTDADIISYNKPVGWTLLTLQKEETKAQKHYGTAWGH